MSIAAEARERISNLLVTSVTDNPVVTREFRTRMRGWKAFMVMGAYCVVMSAVLLIAYYFMSEDVSRMAYGRPYQRMAMGRDLFIVLTWAQTILLTLISPSLSSASITQEVERKTIEMVALTPLTAGKLVVGKQLSDYTYTLILLACSLPLSGITLMLGGISPAEILITYALLAVWTFLLTSLGTMVSSIAKKTPAASLTSFGLSIFYLIYASYSGSGLLYIMYSGGYGYPHMNLQPLMLLSPALGPYGALETASVCGLKVSLALASLLHNIGYGVLFLLLASSHVMHKPAERARSIRLVLTSIFVYIAFLSYGSSAMQLHKQILMQGGIWLLVTSVGISIFFSTGVVKKAAGEPMLRYALSWRRMFKSDIGGAILFVLFLVGLQYVSMGVAAYLNERAQSLTPDPGFWTCFFQIAISSLAMVGGMTAVGVLASSLVKQRGGAAALVVLFALVAFAGYAIIGAYVAFARQMGTAHSSALLTQVAALWPVTPILAAAGEFPKEDAPGWINSAPVITSLIYAAIGFFSLLLAGRAHAKTGGVQEEL